MLAKGARSSYQCACVSAVVRGQPMMCSLVEGQSVSADLWGLPPASVVFAKRGHTKECALSFTFYVAT